MSVHIEELRPKAGWVHAGNEGESVTFPSGTRLRFGRDKGHWSEVMADGNTFCISPEGGVLRGIGDPAPGMPKTLQRWSENIVPPWKTSNSTGVKSKENIFNVADIRLEDLGFNLENCNNCGEVGCALVIVWYIDILHIDYRISFEWRRKEGRVVLYDYPQILIPNGGKVLVKSANFECSKPYRIRGSVPSGNCGHSGAAGCCSCGRHSNDVKQIIQKAFDRLCA